MKSYKPTSPSQRQTVTVDYSALTKKRPEKNLRRRLKTFAGRNNRGVITVRHQGGGVKKLYRQVDFLENKFDIPGTIEALEYDPYRSAFIALVRYADGDRRYVLAHHGAKPGDKILTSVKAPLVPGNRLPLEKIPIGTFVHNIELRFGSGGRLGRAAGSYAEILAHDAGYTDLRMASKEIRKVSSKGLATIGQVSNPDYNLVNLGKAGRSRWLGVRPTVRGSAMNQVDHPYGGGEGRQPRGTKRPKTAWGKVTGGGGKKGAERNGQINLLFKGDRKSDKSHKTYKISIYINS